jgi:hypothetical protein
VWLIIWLVIRYKQLLLATRKNITINWYKGEKGSKKTEKKIKLKCQESKREGKIKKKYRSVIIGTQFRTCVLVMRRFIVPYISFLANINSKFL